LLDDFPKEIQIKINQITNAKLRRKFTEPSTYSRVFLVPKLTFQNIKAVMANSWLSKYSNAALRYFEGKSATSLEKVLIFDPHDDFSKKLALESISVDHG
jgi:hypothetical protein